MSNLMPKWNANISLVVWFVFTTLNIPKIFLPTSKNICIIFIQLSENCQRIKMSDNDSRYVDYKDTEDGHEDNVVEERIIQEENPEVGVSVGISYPILLIIIAIILFAFVYNVVLSLTGEPILAIVCAVIAVLAKKIYIYSIYYYGSVQAQDPNYHNRDEN